MRPFLLAALAFLLPSCGSTHYQIVLRDGREIEAANKPLFVAKTGYFRYKDSRGKDALINKENVLQVKEL